MNPLRLLTTSAFALCASVQSAHAGNYTLTPATLDFGGTHAASASYSADISHAPGGTQTSAAYRSRSGYAGQLQEALSLSLASPSPTLGEASTLQLSAALRYDDASATALVPSTITWSVQSGPLTGISPTGLITAAIIYQNTATTVQGAFRSYTATLPLSVLNTDIDNFGSYAGDKIDDAWQIQYFGPTNPGHTAPADDSDGDGVPNLIEFAFGTSPTSNVSGTPALQYTGTFAGGGTVSATGQPVVAFESIPNGIDFRAIFVRRTDYPTSGLIYTPQFSANLSTWQTSSATPTVLADDGTFQIVTVPYPPLVNGRKARFFRISVNLAP